jgi:hypothetical protein
MRPDDVGKAGGGKRSLNRESASLDRRVEGGLADGKADQRNIVLRHHGLRRRIRRGGGRKGKGRGQGKRAIGRRQVTHGMLSKGFAAGNQSGFPPI